MRPCRPSSLLHGPRGVFLLTKYHLPFAPPPTGTRTSGSQPRDGALPSYPGCALPKPFPPFPPPRVQRQQQHERAICTLWCPFKHIAQPRPTACHSTLPGRACCHPRQAACCFCDGHRLDNGAPFFCLRPCTIPARQPPSCPPSTNPRSSLHTPYTPPQSACIMMVTIKAPLVVLAAAALLAVQQGQAFTLPRTGLVSGAGARPVARARGLLQAVQSMPPPTTTTSSSSAGGEKGPWSPESWRKYTPRQMPIYDDEVRENRVRCDVWASYHGIRAARSPDRTHVHHHTTGRARQGGGGAGQVVAPGLCWRVPAAP